MAFWEGVGLNQDVPEGGAAPGWVLRGPGLAGHRSRGSSALLSSGQGRGRLEPESGNPPPHPILIALEGRGCQQLLGAAGWDPFSLCSHLTPMTQA